MKNDLWYPESWYDDEVNSFASKSQFFEHEPGTWPRVQPHDYVQIMTRTQREENCCSIIIKEAACWNWAFDDIVAYRLVPEEEIQSLFNRDF